jgi:phosphatidylserine/phosphatidylglycerophosphate/cardiolipin synthase-like enzyme
VGSIDVWFSRVRNKSKKNTDVGSDLQALRDLVVNAQESIVYVMFQPGPEPLATMVARASDIYVRGVVSTVTPQNEELFAVDSKPYKTAVVQPEGIVKDFSWWAKEVTRAQFLFPPQAPGIGHAITHAKMIVIDAHLPTCAVITGSHNFSASASEQNDENFIVVRGNTRLAEAYAVACLATYRHYRWRAYVKDMFDSGKRPWEGLSKDPAWQSAYLTPARRRHLEMWCR